MRFLIASIIGIQAALHIHYFLHSIGVRYSVLAITSPVSKAFGMVWLVTAVLLLLAVVLILARVSFWWMFAFIAIVLSQLLIIYCWKEFWWGTLLNLVILIPVIISFFAFQFDRMVQSEVEKMYAEADFSSERLSVSDLAALPSIVQKWLQKSGVMGQPIVASVYLEQQLEMQMDPEKANWIKGKARQHFTTDPPAFNWSVNLEMNPLMPVAGRDKFLHGKGEMTIRLFSLIPVVNARSEQKLNEATLQRYLAEMVWFPSAALSPHVKWKTVDDCSASATMDINGTSASGVFHFDESGRFTKFVAMRYKDVSDSAPREWTVVATRSDTIKERFIPVDCEVKWKLDSGDWTWLKLTITDIEYNRRLRGQHSVVSTE